MERDGRAFTRNVERSRCCYTPMLTAQSQAVQAAGTALAAKTVARTRTMSKADAKALGAESTQEAMNHAIEATMHEGDKTIPSFVIYLIIGVPLISFKSLSVPSILDEVPAANNNISVDNPFPSLHPSL